MAQKSIFMETTDIPVQKTVIEIAALLMEQRAREIATTYDDAGEVSGLRFTLMVGAFPLNFSLPVRIEGLHKVFRERRKGKYNTYQGPEYEKRDLEQAKRIAWRQLFRWLQAQFAMIDVGLVQSHEVFLPYLLQPGSSQTLFEHFEANELKKLPAAGGAR